MPSSEETRTLEKSAAARPVGSDPPRAAEIRRSALLPKVLQHSLRLFERALERARGALNPAAVHALRVSARRLITSLEVAEAVSGANTRRTRKSLARLLDRLGPLRDAQVGQKALKRYRAAEDARAYANRLHKTEERLRRKLRTRVADFKDTRIRKDLKTLRSDLRARAQSLHEERQLRVLAAKAFDGCRRTLETLDYDSARALHAFRLEFKAYRYMAELAIGVLDMKDDILPRMHAYQDALGGINDAWVLRKGFKSFAKTRSRRISPRSKAVCARIEKDLKKRMEHFQAIAPELAQFGPKGPKRARTRLRAGNSRLP